MRATVDEVGRVLEAEGIDAHWAKGGTVVLARTRAQLARARATSRTPAAGGWARTTSGCWPARRRASLLSATKVRGATYTPDCAAVHPGRLVAGLAAAVERRGVTVYERTAATSLEPGRVRTEHGTLRADVVRAGHRGLHAGACAVAVASSRRSTR